MAECAESCSVKIRNGAANLSLRQSEIGNSKSEILTMIHIPILRQSKPYKSLDVARVPHHQTRELFVEISQANAGLIRRDLRDQKTGREKLAAFSTAELIEICARA